MRSGKMAALGAALLCAGCGGGYYDGGYGAPTRTFGPVPAVYGSDTITFSIGPIGNYTLNRVTGVLLNTDTGWRSACQPGKRQF